MAHRYFGAEFGDQYVANSEQTGNQVYVMNPTHWLTVDYAKAVTTKAQEDAVQDLKFGLAEYRKAVESLEKNNDSDAQAHYDTAQGYFDKAAVELWPG